MDAEMPHRGGAATPSDTLHPQEKRELKRVFYILCDYQAKQKLKSGIRSRKEQLSALQLPTNEKKSTVQAKLSQLLSGTDQAGYPEAETEVNKIKTEIKSLKEQLSALQSNPTKIQAADIAANLEALGKKSTKAEVLDMIWEVDENLDQCVDWEETQLMFLRNANDVTGLEPSKLYNMIQFMMYDISNSGTVSVDEAMNMLYSRYGRNRMDHRLKEMFGDKLEETGKQGGEIDFNHYVACAERTELETFLATSSGKLLLAKSDKKNVPSKSPIQSKA